MLGAHRPQQLIGTAFADPGRGDVAGVQAGAGRGPSVRRFDNQAEGREAGPKLLPPATASSGHDVGDLLTLSLFGLSD
jgi:hypothetical protein